MAVVGAPSEWVDLIDSMVPEILRLVVATWRDLAPPDADAKEDAITETLCRALRRNRDARRLMFNIEIQQVELEPAPGQDLGRMDIAFRPLVPREDIYFCLENKRLNVVKDGTTRAYASEYVVFGMVRFVTGQYAKAVRHGGMLAYVLDGKVPGAIANVEANITSHHETLGMAAPGKFLSSTILPNDPYARETHHRRPHSSGLFRIHHLFMPRESS